MRIGPGCIGACCNAGAARFATGRWWRIGSARRVLSRSRSMTATAVATPALAAAVAGPPHGAVRGLVEIDLPNGCRVRVEQDIPTAALRRIIGALVRR